MNALLAILLLAQARKIEGSAHESTVEANGKKLPAIACEGTTDLPEKSRLDAKLYYGPLEFGRHLDFRVAEVTDGKFRMVFPTFPEKNLAGSYSIHVEFNPYLQQQEIQEKLGKHLRLYEVEIPLAIGTEEDAARDRRRVQERLGREVDALRNLVGGVMAKLAERPAAVEWNRFAQDWGTYIREIERRCIGVPEYRALRIDDLSEQSMEELTACVYAIIRAAGAWLAKPDDAALASALQEHRTGFDTLRRPIVLRLGVEKASAKELTDRLNGVRTPVVDAHEFYRALRKEKAPEIDYYKAKLGLYRKAFRRAALEMVDIAPDARQEAVRKILEKGTSFFRGAEEAGDFKDDRTDTLRELLEEFRKEVDAFEAALRNSP